MKKYFVVLLLLVAIFPFMRVKADIGSICDYEGWLNKSTNQSSSVKTVIDKDRYKIMLSSIYPFQTTNAMLGWADMIAQLTSGGMTGFPEFPYELTFTWQLKSIERATIMTDILTLGSDDLDVSWPNDSERTEFRDKGYCPSVITIASKSGLALTGTFDFYLVGGEAQSPSADTSDSSIWNALKAENFYLKASLFSPELSQNFKTWSTTCVSDIDTIRYITSFYDFSHPNLSGATDSEKQFVADLYKNNGLTEAAENFIKNYKPGTDCYNNNPAAQEAYKALVSACDDFLYNYANGSDLQSVDTCEEIIGDGTFAHYLNQVFRFIQYLGPIIVIVYSTIEYIKAAATSDADLLKKTNKRTITRLIFAALLFLIPMIIKVILDIIGFYGNCLDTIL